MNHSLLTTPDLLVNDAVVRAPIEGPIHVVHVFGTLMPGGAERQALAIMRHSNGSRFRHSAINYWADENDIGPQFVAAGCPLHLLDKPSVSLPRFLWQLRSLLKRLRPDVVHAWLYAPSFWGRAAAILAGVPGIVASTRTSLAYTRWYEGFLDRLLSRRTQVRIVNSQNVKSLLVDRVRLSPDLIEVIYNGVDPSRLVPSADRPTLRTRLGWPADAPVLLCVGRLVAAKNYPMLFRVVLRLRERHPDMRSFIAGWGPLYDSLLAQREDMGLTGTVEFLNRREDVADLMSAADLFVSTSSTEGFSNALLEAMWLGLPVVTTRVSGAVEIVRDGLNGIIVDVDDDETMLSRIGGLLADQRLRQRLAEQARTNVRERFTLEASVAAHENVYERVARSAGRGRIANRQ